MHFGAFFLTLVYQFPTLRESDPLPKGRDAGHARTTTRFEREICTNFARCISITDDIQINKQNKSLGIGPLYLKTEFEAI